MSDGKAIRSTDAIKTIESMMNIVTAYTDIGISLGQVIVDGKSNVIPKARKLIELIDIKGTIIISDAMHCQRETAETIINIKGDDVLQLKSNQGNFYLDVYLMFDSKYMSESSYEDEYEYEIFTTIEKSHGRIETRTCYALNNLEYFEG